MVEHVTMPVLIAILKPPTGRCRAHIPCDIQRHWIKDPSVS